MSQKLNIVVAACENMGIGIGGGIPWRLKKDMAFFKNITKATRDEKKRNAVIMGRKTWDSIPPKFRPLEGRMNIILTSQLTEAPPGAVLARCFTDALDVVAESEGIESVFVIGGASVYREAMTCDLPCKIYFTRVDGNFNCDVFLPEIDKNVFKKIEHPEDVPSGRLVENGIPFSFEVHEKP